MAEGNGELNDDVSSTKADDRGDGEKTEDYVKLLEYGLDRKVRKRRALLVLIIVRRNIFQTFLFCSAGRWKTGRYLQNRKIIPF